MTEAGTAGLAPAPADSPVRVEMRQIRRAFGSLPRVSRIPRNPTAEPEQAGERRMTVHFDLRSPILMAAWHAPPTGHEDAEALDVLAQILSGGRSSRLYRRLVREAEQALYANGHYSELHDAGLFRAHVGVRPDGSIDRVEEMLFEEIARVRDVPVAQEEVAKAKRQLEVSLVTGLTTNYALGWRIASETLALGRIRPLDERLAAYRAVTVEDVQRVARTYLRDDHRNVVRVVPPAQTGVAGDPS